CCAGACRTCRGRIACGSIRCRASSRCWDGSSSSPRRRRWWSRFDSARWCSVSCVSERGRGRGGPGRSTHETQASGPSRPSPYPACARGHDARRLTVIRPSPIGELMFRVCSAAVGALAALSGLPCMAQVTARRAVAIVGTWRLESVVDTLPDGSLYSSLGARPTGEIRYDATGHMAVQFMRDPRPTVRAGTAREATPQELRALYDGYYAYFGRYELNARGDSVAHFIHASLHPEEVGVVYRRAVRVDADRLFRSEEHTSELQSLAYIVCRLLLEKKNLMYIIECAV